MENAFNSTTKSEHSTENVNIELKELETEFVRSQPNNWPPNYGPPPDYYQQPPGQYYAQNPYYHQAPGGYQQRVGGQNVYVASGGYPTEPPNVSRGRQVYIMNYPNQSDDSEYYRDPNIFTESFNSIAIRNRFVQRVYTILALQLVISFGFILMTTFVDPVKRIFAQNFLPIMIVSMVLYLALYLALACCVDLRRRFPINFILLALLTIAMTLLLCCVVAFTKAIAVLAAMGTTAVVCFLVSIFACQTKWDVTGCGMCLCIGSLVLMIYGVVIMVLSLCGIHMPILHVIFSGLSVLLFSFWLMYDTQMIVGGRRIELSPEEYIFGALCLYVDIMYIFMHLVTLYEYCLGGR